MLLLLLFFQILLFILLFLLCAGRLLHFRLLPQTYPDPGEPDPGGLDGARLKAQLSVLADEVLDVRRRWHEQEQRERA